MKKNEEKMIFISIAVIIAVIALMFFVRSKVEDIEFCRIVLLRLIKGNFSAQNYIDWEGLKTKKLVGFDVGQGYSSLSSKKDRELFRKTFIKGFHFGFNKGKGGMQDFTNWRTVEKGLQQAVIAADYKGKTILFTISRIGEKKLTGIQWQ